MAAVLHAIAVVIGFQIAALAVVAFGAAVWLVWFCEVSPKDLE